MMVVLSAAVSRHRIVTLLLVVVSVIHRTLSLPTPQDQPYQLYPSVITAASGGGGYSTVDLNDERVKDISTFVATSVSQALSSSHPSLAEFRTVTAQSQLAWGQNYKVH